MRRSWRGWLAGALAASALAVSALAVTACASGPGAPAPPSAYLGTVVDTPVPASVADLPLTTDAGRATSLDALHGQVVVPPAGKEAAGCTVKVASAGGDGPPERPGTSSGP